MKIHTNYIKLDKLKNALVIVILIKFINIFLLYFLNGTSFIGLIRLLVIIDIITEFITITSIYPLITTMLKSETQISLAYYMIYLRKKQN